jgi:hypothetical protein
MWPSTRSHRVLLGAFIRARVNWGSAHNHVKPTLAEGASRYDCFHAVCDIAHRLTAESNAMQRRAMRIPSPVVSMPVFSTPSVSWKYFELLGCQHLRAIERRKCAHGAEHLVCNGIGASVGLVFEVCRLRVHLE